MISSLLKLVMKEFGLQQAGLAEVMGVSLDRVKSLASGKAKNLKREEGEALIKKLHIRGDWLATGEGQMRQSDGERELSRRMDLLKLASGKAQIEGLDAHDSRRLMEILFYAEMGSSDDLHRVLNPLAADEIALLASYRRCSQADRIALIQDAAVRSAGISAQARPGEPQQRSAESQQVFQGDVGQPVQVSGNMNQRNVRFSMGKGKK